MRGENAWKLTHFSTLYSKKSWTALEQYFHFCLKKLLAGVGWKEWNAFLIDMFWQLWLRHHQCYWKTDSLPSLREWRTKVYYVFSMSKLSAMCRTRLGSEEAWAQFRKWSLLTWTIYSPWRIRLIMEAIWHYQCKNVFHLFSLFCLWMYGISI